jgi:hypothetical protein
MNVQDMDEKAPRIAGLFFGEKSAQIFLLTEIRLFGK